MKRIITWGLRYADFSSQRELFALMAADEAEVVAEVCYEPSDEEIFGKRSMLEDALRLPHDMILFFETEVLEVEKRLMAEGVSIDGENITSLSTLTEPRNKIILERQIGIIKELIDAEDGQISDRSWLSQRLFAYGFYPFFKLVKKPQPGVTYSMCGILQVPDEFVNFCIYISGLKCKNAIEIGVARGGSSYVMAALLYRNNPELVYDMVDINDSLVNFDEMKKLIPALRKRIPSTSNDYVKEKYDFCFIDADHSYSAVMEDYRNVGQYADKVTVFHDVFGHEYDELDGGTVRGWKEIKELVEDKEIKEFASYPARWMGIGVINWS